MKCVPTTLAMLVAITSGASLISNSARANPAATGAAATADPLASRLVQPTNYYGYGYGYGRRYGYGGYGGYGRYYGGYGRGYYGGYGGYGRGYYGGYGGYGRYYGGY
jgi:hypothetical protein